MSKKYLPTSAEWLAQSQLLLQARPDSARVITKYQPNPPPKKRKLNPKKRKATEQSSDHAKKARTEEGGKGETEASGTEAEAGADENDNIYPARPPRLVVKTYDPVSGVCLKYETQEQREVGRLIGIGGLLSTARVMVGDVKPGAVADAGASEKEAHKEGDIQLPDRTKEDSAAVDGEAEAEAPAGQGHQRAKKSVSFAPGAPEVHKLPKEGGGDGGGGKKKKKGKGR